MKNIFSNFSMPNVFSALLAVSVAILASLLFYVVVPHLRLTQHITNPEEVASKIISTTSVNTVIIWDLNIAQNSRALIGFASKDTKELVTVKKITKSLEDIKLTAALGAQELHSILSAEALCNATPELTPSSSPVTRQFVADHPNAYFCLIPITDASGAVSGLINAVWYTKPTNDMITGTIAQARFLVKTS